MAVVVLSKQDRCLGPGLLPAGNPMEVLAAALRSSRQAGRTGADGESQAGTATEDLR
jgi:hypothetical protein